MSRGKSLEKPTRGIMDQNLGEMGLEASKISSRDGDRGMVYGFYAPTTTDIAEVRLRPSSKRL